MAHNCGGAFNVLAKFNVFVLQWFGAKKIDPKIDNCERTMAKSQGKVMLRKYQTKTCFYLKNYLLLKIIF